MAIFFSLLHLCRGPSPARGSQALVATRLIYPLDLGKTILAREACAFDWLLRARVRPGPEIGTSQAREEELVERSVLPGNEVADIMLYMHTVNGTVAMKMQSSPTPAPARVFATPLHLSRVQGGVAKPAADYRDKSLDLNELLIRHRAATFYCRVSGGSMVGAGIHDGDYLIVDRALRPAHGDVVVAAIDGELTCKIIDLHHQRLRAANPGYPPIPIRNGSTFTIEGVVTSSIRTHRCLP